LTEVLLIATVSIIGYFVPDSYKKIDYNDFEERFKDKNVRDSMTMLFFKRENEDQKIYVFFSDKEKFTKEELKLKMEIMKNSHTSNAIIVLQNETNVVITPKKLS